MKKAKEKKERGFVQVMCEKGEREKVRVTAHLKSRGEERKRGAALWS